MDWDEMARPWLDAAPELEKAHRPVLDALLNSANLSPGERVLDVGCGTGPSLVAASNLVGEAGSVTGVDIAPPLLARAAERVPANVDLVNADAGKYSFNDAHFDVVQANFGIMFFDDNEEAFSNLRRAVKSDGRFAATVWGMPSDNPWFSIPRQIVDQFIANVPRPDPAGPGPMRFGDVSKLEEHLRSTGWNPNTQTIDIELLPPGPPEQVAELHMKITAGMNLSGVNATENELEAIKKAITEACRKLERDGQVFFPARVHVVTAQPM